VVSPFIDPGTIYLLVYFSATKQKWFLFYSVPFRKKIKHILPGRKAKMLKRYDE